MSGITWPEKTVAGLTCHEVLERLSDYLDGDLSQADRATIEAHLRGCDGCARFGGEFRSTVQALRDHLLRGPTPPARLLERLLAAVDREPGEG